MASIKEALGKPFKMRTFFGSQTNWELRILFGKRYRDKRRRQWWIVSATKPELNRPATSHEVALWRALPTKMKEPVET